MFFEDLKQVILGAVLHQFLPRSQIGENAARNGTYLPSDCLDHFKPAAE